MIRAVVAVGRVREVAPQADPVTRTFQVRVGLQDPPEAMRLGINRHRHAGAALSGDHRGSRQRPHAGRASPAVWVVDPATSTVSLRPVDILRFDVRPRRRLAGAGPGEIIVTGGIQALHPGQRVAPHSGRGRRRPGNRGLAQYPSSNEAAA